MFDFYVLFVLFVLCTYFEVRSVLLNTTKWLIFVMTAECFFWVSKGLEVLWIKENFFFRSNML